jgi:hypothetical protein
MVHKSYGDGYIYRRPVDQTTVNLVATKRVFPKIKVVDRDTDLVFSSEKQYICQFVIGCCNLHTDISLPNWRKPAQKYVTQTINHLCNDCNTVMKWTVPGKLHGMVCNKIRMPN